MSLCGNVDAAGIRMPLHRFAGTIRRNKHRDDRAHGRLQNPLAQNDVRAGEPSRRWEARWNKWKGHPLSPHQVNRRVQALAKLAGLDGVSAHSGRRGMASELVRRGASTTAVQQAGGWRDPQMVARYASAVSVEDGAVARYFG